MVPLVDAETQNEFVAVYNRFWKMGMKKKFEGMYDVICHTCQICLTISISLVNLCPRMNHEKRGSGTDFEDAIR